MPLDEPIGARPKLDWYDGLLLMGTLSLVALFSFHSFSNPPFEDAAILMRYSNHLAKGWGIVWNVGDKPVDGATDFLFMVLVAGLVKGGLPAVAAARLLDLGAHVLTVILVYLATRGRGESGRWAAAVSAAYLGVGPGIGYIADSFGTPVFALFACLSWWFAVRVERDGISHANSLMFALCGLMMGLARPEGVFLASLMLLAILYAKGFKKSGLVMTYFAATFAIAGGLYFAWRWNYFGYPFPNPFYIKGGGRIYWASLFESLQNVAALSGLFSLVYVLAFCWPRTASRATFSLIPIAGFTFLWILMSNAMNHLMRYQYPILPIVLLSWFPLVEAIREELKLPRFEELQKWSQRLSLGVLAIVLLCALTYRGVFWAFASSVWWNPNYDTGVLLSEFKDRHYALATSEVGLLPLYSDWRTIDTWGLNDPWVAHNGTITESYLKRRNPEVIVFHASFSPILQPVQDEHWPFPEAWFAMVMTLKNYAERNGYCLAGAFGEAPQDTYYYYVRSDFADSAEIIRRIRNMENTWKSMGKRIVNFADLKTRDPS